VSVTVGAGQKVFVTSDAALGSLASGAGQLNIYICQQSGPTLTTVGGGIFGLTVPPNQRHTFGISAVITGLAPGTYTVGMCGSSLAGANWNNSEWSYTSAMVLP
jgi:hypothetical protein